jgi:hypothetical protein
MPTAFGIESDILIEMRCFMRLATERFAVALSILALAACCVWAQDGTGPNVQENGAVINPKNLSQVVYADQYCTGTGTCDIGTAIISALSAIGSGGQATIRIRQGTYNWNPTTVVTIDPRLISIVGDGAPLVHITCSVAQCLTLDETVNGGTFSISQGGRIGGFTLIGTSITGQTGITAHAVIGELYEDIVFYRFDGAGAVALSFHNRNTEWMERTVARKIRFGDQVGGNTYGNTVGWNFQYDGGNNNTGQSFGYSDLEAECDKVLNGQTCILLTSGYLYHSKIHFLGNFGSGTTFISVAAPPQGFTPPMVSAMTQNAYNIFAEGSQGAYGIVVAQGASFTGYGTVRTWNVGGVIWNQNNNGPTFGGTARVVQGNSSPLFENVGDAGTISNFLGTGNTATFYPQLVGNVDTPYASLGYLYGPNVWSPYVSMYSGQPNAFEVFGCPYNPSSFASCASEARVDSSGNVHAAGAFYANGSDYAESVHVRGKLGRYEPGDVLSVDSRGKGQFVKSNKAYSTRVAGIYSSKPGVLGSSHSMATSEFKEEIPLAINGIVPCKVSAENGEIKPGDLLVTSSTPGYAMRGTERSRMLGAVVGKALGTIRNGKGLIPILVTLQ